ncbi:hypothetical protein BC833DRAFT_571470 [Globomyces pollinis-pini]|nr:hypothetical protein BC833DRAFT_571470 [Globomyces pollinis-pini]
MSIPIQKSQSQERLRKGVSEEFKISDGYLHVSNSPSNSRRNSDSNRVRKLSASPRPSGVTRTSQPKLPTQPVLDDNVPLGKKMTPQPDRKQRKSIQNPPDYDPAKYVLPKAQDDCKRQSQLQKPYELSHSRKRSSSKSNDTIESEEKTSERKEKEKKRMTMLNYDERRKIQDEKQRDLEALKKYEQGTAEDPNQPFELPIEEDTTSFFVSKEFLFGHRIWGFLLSLGLNIWFIYDSGKLYFNDFIAYCWIITTIYFFLSSLRSFSHVLEKFRKALSFDLPLMEVSFLCSTSYMFLMFVLFWSYIYFKDLGTVSVYTLVQTVIKYNVGFPLMTFELWISRHHIVKSHSIPPFIILLAYPFWVWITHYVWKWDWPSKAFEYVFSIGVNFWMLVTAIVVLMLMQTAAIMGVWILIKFRRWVWKKLTGLKQARMILKEKQKEIDAAKALEEQKERDAQA